MTNTATHIDCRWCREPVDPAATFCPHCQRRIRGVALGQVAGAAAVLLAGLLVVAVIVALYW